MRSLIVVKRCSQCCNHGCVLILPLPNLISVLNRISQVCNPRRLSSNSLSLRVKDLVLLQLLDFNRIGFGDTKGRASAFDTIPLDAKQANLVGICTFVQFQMLRVTFAAEIARRVNTGQLLTDLMHRPQLQTGHQMGLSPNFRAHWMQLPI